MYKYKLKGLMKGIDPDRVVQELERIENVYGELKPEIIVEEASDEGNVLHNYFTWDNDKAANQWRMQQARILLNNIEVQIISGDGEKEYFAVYEVGASNTYKHVTSFNKDDIEFIKLTIKTEISHLQKKLKQYQNFKKVYEALEIAMHELDAA